MRKVVFTAALTMALAAMACGGEEQKPPQTPVAPPPATTAAPTPAPTATETAAVTPAPAPSPMELQKKTMMGYAEALNARDAKKLASFYTDTAVVKMAGMPDHSGREAIAASWQHMFDAFSNTKSAANRVLVKGDVVIVEWSMTATHSGDLGPIKATEKPVGFNGADVMWFTPEGLIKEQHVYHDMGTIMGQIGKGDPKMKVRPIPTVSTTPPAVVVSTNGADETKNLDVVHKMNAAIEKKSDADFVASMDDKIEWDDMMMPETMKGKDAGKKWLKTFTTAFPDAKATETGSWAVGDFVAVESTMSGTQKGDLGPIKATKKPVTLHGLDIVQLKDGKIVHGWGYGNGAEMMMQLGLMPKPGDAKAADAKPADAKGGSAPAAKASTPAPAAPAAPKK